MTGEKMKKKLSKLFVKIGLMAVLAFSFPLAQSPASYCFATDGQEPPIQDGSKERPKQGPKKEEQPKDSSAASPLLLLIYWLLG